MEADFFKDLLLSGVKWELNDTPIILCDIASDKGVENISDIPITNVRQMSIIAPAQPIDSDTAKADAQNIADHIDDWDALCVAIRGFDKHPLYAFAKNTVLPKRGNDNKLVVITDSVSSDDEASGNILSGISGDLFDKMINAIGLSRDDISIIPLVFWRAPGGRTPTGEEIDIAKPFVKRAIKLINPNTVLTLGTLAASEIADAKLPLQHGKEVPARAEYFEIPTISIYHPNYVILKPDTKKLVWSALQKLKSMIFS